MFSPTSVVITIDRASSFTAKFGKQVEAISFNHAEGKKSSGTYQRHPAKWSQRRVELPWNYQGKRLFRQILSEYPHKDSIVNFQGLHSEFRSASDAFGYDTALVSLSYFRGQSTYDKSTSIDAFVSNYAERYAKWELTDLPEIQVRLDERAALERVKKSTADEAVELLHEILIRAGCVVKSVDGKNIPYSTYSTYGFTEVTIADLTFTLGLFQNSAKRVVEETIPDAESDAAE